MKKLGDILRETRQEQQLSQNEVAKELLLKPEILDAIEIGDWESLPDPAYVRGFIKNYAQLLGLDSIRLLALYRAEYDEKKFPKKLSLYRTKKGFMFTPNKLAPLIFILTAIAFVIYIAVQYTSILAAPKLQIYTPQDDMTTTATVIEISGSTVKDAEVAVNGQLIPVDSSGNFSFQLPLSDGKNTIEIIASRRLSPKTKISRTVRLSR